MADRDYSTMDGNALFKELIGKRMTLDEAISTAIAVSDDYDAVVVYEDMSDWELDTECEMEKVRDETDILMIRIKMAYGTLTYFPETVKEDECDRYLDKTIWQTDETIEYADRVFYDASAAVDMAEYCLLHDLPENRAHILQTLRNAIEQIEKQRN